MLIIRHHAVYNSRNPEMLTPLRRSGRALSRIALLLALFVVASGHALATDWKIPEQQLAQKIVAATGPGAVAFQMTNRSSLSKKELDDIRQRSENPPYGGWSPNRKYGTIRGDRACLILGKLAELCLGRRDSSGNK